MKKILFAILIVSTTFTECKFLHFRHKTCDVVDMNHITNTKKSLIAVNGNIWMGMKDGIPYESKKTSHKYIIVFQCEYGKTFSVDKKELFLKLKKRDKVNVKYIIFKDNDYGTDGFNFIDADKM